MEKRSPLIALCIVLLAGIPASPVVVLAQDPGRNSQDELFSDSLASAYRASIRAFKTAELERRIAARRGVQRSGYSQTLAGVLRRDGLGALFSFIRMRLHLEFSLPHDQLYAYFPSRYKVEPVPGVPPTYGAENAMTVVPLYEDRTFPEDPWKKE